MGQFYTNVTLKGPTQLEIAKCIARKPRWAGISPSYGDLTVVYDSASELQDGSAYRFVSPLSKALGCIALYVSNHSDSILHYRLYKAGDVIDDYDSNPNYFHGDPAPPNGGNAEVLCDAFGRPSARDKIHEILHYDSFAHNHDDRYVFEVDRHRDIAVTLCLPLIAVGYGYANLAEDCWPEGLSPDNIIVVEGETETE